VVEALYVLEVPRSHELPDANGFDQQEYEARCALDEVRLQARARGLRVRVKLIRTRNPGKAIVEEALARDSDLIYISTEHAPSRERLLGPTVRYVLAKRPCRVVVEGGADERQAASRSPLRSPSVAPSPRLAAARSS